MSLNYFLFIIFSLFKIFQTQQDSKDHKDPQDHQVNEIEEKWLTNRIDFQVANNYFIDFATFINGDL